jgi:hypothetical protein
MRDDMNKLSMHDLEDGGFMVCSNMGIVEPITMSIFKFLTSPGMDTIEWFKDAVARNSLPLCSRIDIALAQLNRMPKRSEWAAKMRKEYIAPALGALFSRRRQAAVRPPLAPLA